MFKKLGILLLLILAVYGIYRIREAVNSKYVNVRFESLEPIPKNTPVYVKGVNVGKVDKIRLTDSIEYSLVRLMIDKRYKLPLGTTARVYYNKLNREYILLKIPDPPYEGYLKTGDVIEGTMSPNIRKMIDEYIEKGSVDDAITQASSGLNNISDAADKINEAADLIVDIIKDNRPEIDRIIKNFADASEDTSYMISELREAIKDPQVRSDIRDMAKNLAISAKSLKETTSNPKINQSIDNIYKMTTSLNTSSIKLDCLMCKTSNVLDNADNTLDSLTFTSDGISDMLSKKFLFFRFMFGQPGAKLQKEP